MSAVFGMIRTRSRLGVLKAWTRPVVVETHPLPRHSGEGIRSHLGHLCPALISHSWVANAFSGCGDHYWPPVPSSSWSSTAPIIAHGQMRHRDGLFPRPLVAFSHWTKGRQGRNSISLSLKIFPNTRPLTHQLVLIRDGGVEALRVPLETLRSVVLPLARAGLDECTAALFNNQPKGWTTDILHTGTVSTRRENPRFVFFARRFGPYLPALSSTS